MDKGSNRRFEFIIYGLLLLFASALSALTMVFAAIPMRITRKSFGSAWFWAGHLVAGTVLMALGFPIFGIGVLAFAILIGSYSELENHNSSVFSAAFLALAITVGVGSLATAVWSYQTKTDLLHVLREHAGNFVTQMNSVYPDAKVNVEVLAQQIPSALVVLLMLGLAAGLIGERPLYRWFRLPRVKERESADLTSFRVPDVFVWVTILAVPGAFLQHGKPMIELISSNVLNVLLMLYFFQGLAVVIRSFRVFKVGVFWRGALFILFAAQLFPVVALLGFVDFWLDFRARFGKRAEEIKNGL